MNRKFVTSHRISSVGWENNILEVEFKDGTINKYYGVSEQEYLALINSPSLDEEIDSMEHKHPYQRVN